VASGAGSAAASAPGAAAALGDGGSDVERLRAEVEALNHAKRRLMVENRKLNTDVEERDLQIKVLKQKMSRAGMTT
jgi:hypothetical protein